VVVKSPFPFYITWHSFLFMRDYTLQLLWLFTFLVAGIGSSTAADKSAKPSTGASRATQPKPVEPKDEITLEDLLKTVDKLKDPTEPRSVKLTDYLAKNATIHKELQDQFRKDYPKLLKDALASSGNLHNPKMIPLRGVFAECLLKTPTVQKVAEKLKGMGLMLDGVVFEKFFYWEPSAGEGKRIGSIAWLKVKPAAK
jgi:hypothetical protein